MSLDQTITITVDETNDGATTADVDHVYERYQEFDTRSVYHFSGHEPDSRDMLSFYRTPAKRNGNDRGSQKTSFKFTKDVIVTGVDGSDIVKTQYYELNCSIPLGVDEAERILQRQRVVALADDDDIMEKLTHYLHV